MTGHDDWTRVTSGRTVLALDIGTTAVKVAAVRDGHPLETAEAALRLDTPRPGWAEQDPDAWWAGVRAAVGSLRRGSSAAALADVEAISVTGQMQDLVVLDHAGSPVRPAILYSDVRAADEHAELLSRLGPGWAAAAGATPDATNVAAKWLWFVRHEPTAAARTAVVLFGAHSAVVHRLTAGVAECDRTTAATTGLYDIGTATWWDPAATLTGCPLPALASADRQPAPLAAGPAAQLGLPAGLPVIHAPGDAVATTIGLVGTQTERPYAYLGTSGWVAVATPEPRPAPGVVVLPGIHSDHWVSALPMPTAGAALDWVRATLLGGVTVAELDELAGTTCAASEGVMFLPHLDGARLPRAAPEATGMLVGVRRSTTRATIAAAAVEGVAHSVRQLLALAAPDAASLAVCGGLARSPVVRQVLADVTGRPVELLADEHAALLGAAYAAGAPSGAPIAPAAPRATAVPRSEHGRAHAAIANAFDALLPSMALLLTGLVEIRERTDR